MIPTEPRRHISFSQKLIINLSFILVMIFCTIITITFFTSQRLVDNNNLNRIQSASANLAHILEDKLINIEKIPQTIFNFIGEANTQMLNELPLQIRNAYPFLTNCYVHSDSSDFPDDYSCPFEEMSCQPHFSPDTLNVFRRTAFNGCWTFKKIQADSTLINYSETICNKAFNFPHSTLNIELKLNTITDFICSIRLYNSSHFFIVDNQGNLLTKLNSKEFNTITQEFSDNIISTLPTNSQSETSDVFMNNTKYYVHYSPLPLQNCHLGFICSYSTISRESREFYFSLFTTLCFGLILMISIIPWIVHKLNIPIKQFAEKVRATARGEFDTNIPQFSSNDEFQELQESFIYMQRNIQTYIQRLRNTSNEKEKIITEMHLAQKIQQSFMPKIRQLPSHIELHGTLKQCKTIGGDLYDYFVVDNYLYFVIGDVSGKGIPASLYMSSFVKLFRYVASHETSTARICSTINTHMYDTTEDAMYVTIIVGILDMETGTVQYCNAGHPAPLVISDNSQVFSLKECTNPPIGILDDYQFSEDVYTIDPYSQLLFYTDGITDAENMDAVLFGKERLIQCISDHSLKNPKDIIEKVITAVENHIGQANQSDDFTLFSIFYKGKIKE